MYVFAFMFAKFYRITVLLELPASTDQYVLILSHFLFCSTDKSLSKFLHKSYIGNAFLSFEIRCSERIVCMFNFFNNLYFRQFSLYCFIKKVSYVKFKILQSRTRWSGTLRLHICLWMFTFHVKCINIFQDLLQWVSFWTKLAVLFFTIVKLLNGVMQLILR